jgi:hypothetical protein
LKHVTLFIFELNISIGFVFYKHSIDLTTVRLEDSTAADSSII